MQSKEKAIKTLVSIYLIFVATLTGVLGQQLTLTGKITDTYGEPLYSATVVEVNSGKGVVSNNNGVFLLKLEKADYYKIQVGFIGYETITDSIVSENTVQITRNYTLIQGEEIEKIVVIGNEKRSSTFNPINIKSFSQVPTVSGNLESMLKTLPGVASGNELSSQYSVRGGSFDENLIYVNDIEIYRPLLVQSAKQEGLSFVNPELVSSINFSAGGFNAEYGDKMSSVLNIYYRKPTEFNGSVTASLLGSSAHVEGASKNGKVTHTSGVRYKSTKYILGTLDTKGDYSPTFIDFQSYVTCDLSDKLELSFLGNFARNQFEFEPDTRVTDFGMLQQTYRLTVFYEGREIDFFDTYMGALTLNYRPTDNFLIKIINSGFYSHEEVTYDILGEYRISEALSTSSSSDRDSIVDIGIGADLEHARNYLDATIISSELKGTWAKGVFNIQWGTKWKSENISEQVNEWNVIDSVGHTLPNSNQNITMTQHVNFDTVINRNTFSGYLQGVYSFSSISSDYTLTLGARYYYSDREKERLISPRMNIVAQPYWADRLSFHLATGIYYQPAFYKELRDYMGNFYDVKAQKSTHFVAGMDFNFDSWGRPFVFTTEAFYKNISNVIPYKVDDVRIIYMPDYQAKAYATGIDFKVYGEFIQGLESWFSLSLLRTMEDVKNDTYTTNSGKVTRPEYYRRASDQLFNLSVFFQDYLPMNPKYRVHVTLNLTSGLPYPGPDYDTPSEIFNLGPYRRVDMGFSRLIKEKKKGKFGLNDTYIALEVLNVFDVRNKVSYDWVNTVANNTGYFNTYGVPNKLTGRRFNIKLSTKL